MDSAAYWDERYAAEGFRFGRAANAWLAAQAARLPDGGSVLCVADGEGRNSVHLARLGMRVSAFDVSPVGVDKARRLAEHAGVQAAYAVAAVDDYDWPVGTLDGVAAIFVQFAGPALRERMFARMAEALKPGGLLLLLGYGPKQLEYRTGGPGLLENLYTAEALSRRFSPTLDIVELREWDEVLDEGAGHAGPSALVGLVARRR